MVNSCLDNLESAARSTDNMVTSVLDAVANRVTVGEISGRLRQVWGDYEAS
jgi:methylmalonyl-CoA mutase N-terminal domain/subunit